MDVPSPDKTLKITEFYKSVIPEANNNSTTRRMASNPPPRLNKRRREVSERCLKSEFSPPRSFQNMLFSSVTTCNTGTSMIDESYVSEFLRDIETQTPSYMIQQQQTSSASTSANTTTAPQPSTSTNDWPWT